MPFLQQVRLDDGTVLEVRIGPGPGELHVTRTDPPNPPSYEVLERLLGPEYPRFQREHRIRVESKLFPSLYYDVTPHRLCVFRRHYASGELGGSFVGESCINVPGQTIGQSMLAVYLLARFDEHRMLEIGVHHYHDWQDIVRSHHRKWNVMRMLGFR